MASSNTTINGILSQFEDAIRERIGHLERVKPEHLGLDYRVGWNFWVDGNDIIVHRKDNRTLRYYGGFEYISDDHVTHVGDYVIYSLVTDQCEVDECIHSCLTHYHQKMQWDRKQGYYDSKYEE